MGKYLYFSYKIRPQIIAIIKKILKSTTIFDGKSALNHKIKNALKQKHFLDYKDVFIKKNKQKKNKKTLL